LIIGKSFENIQNVFQDLLKEYNNITNAILTLQQLLFI